MKLCILIIENQTVLKIMKSPKSLLFRNIHSENFYNILSVISLYIYVYICNFT